MTLNDFTSAIFKSDVRPHENDYVYVEIYYLNGTYAWSGVGFIVAFYPVPNGMNVMIRDEISNQLYTLAVVSSINTKNVCIPLGYANRGKFHVPT